MLLGHTAYLPRRVLRRLSRLEEVLGGVRRSTYSAVARTTAFCESGILAAPRVVRVGFTTQLGQPDYLPSGGPRSAPAPQGGVPSGLGVTYHHGTARGDYPLRGTGPDYPAEESHSLGVLQRLRINLRLQRFGLSIF